MLEDHFLRGFNFRELWIAEKNRFDGQIPRGRQVKGRAELSLVK